MDRKEGLVPTNDERLHRVPPGKCPTPKPDETHVYIAIYGTNDSRARKECSAVMLFGQGNDTRSKKGTESSSNYDWKYVHLPCPTCEFSHEFKRVCWWEALHLPVPPSYFDEDEED